MLSHATPPVSRMWRHHVLAEAHGSLADVSLATSFARKEKRPPHFPATIAKRFWNANPSASRNIAVGPKRLVTFVRSPTGNLNSYSQRETVEVCTVAMVEDDCRMSGEKVWDGYRRPSNRRRMLSMAFSRLMPFDAISCRMASSIRACRVIVSPVEVRFASVCCPSFLSPRCGGGGRNAKSGPGK